MSYHSYSVLDQSHYTELEYRCFDALRATHELAARQGLEPRYHGPKPCVLPLDDRAILNL